jgi:ArsR family transcriptional regulator, virulence genes transcriptional regulator
MFIVMNIEDMDVERIQAKAETVSDLMKVLSSKNRLMILCQLVDGEAKVGELASRLGLRDQAMSQQLALLRKDGLVQTRREGQMIFYSLADENTKRLLGSIYEIFCDDETADGPGC